MGLANGDEPKKLPGCKEAPVVAILGEKYPPSSSTFGNESLLGVGVLGISGTVSASICAVTSFASVSAA